MKNEEFNSKVEFDFYDILLTLVKHKKFIILFTFLISVGAVIFVLVTPEEWSATTTFKTVDDSGSSLSLSSSLLGLGSSMLSGESSSMDHLVTLNSKSFQMHIIKKFELEDYFEVNDPNPIVQEELALEKFINEMYSVGINNENELISIKILSKDRNFSATIANYSRNYLDEYTKTSKLTKSKEKREFIEQRTLALKDSIYKLADDIKVFLEINDLTEVEKQTEEMISVYSEILKEKVSLQSEMLLQNKYFDNNSLQVKMLNDELQYYNDIIEGFKTGNENNTFDISLNELPGLLKQYVLLETQLNVYTAAYEYIYPQLEAARIEEIEDTDSIDVVDLATPQGLRAKPKRAKVCVLMFFAGIILSSVISIYIESLTNKDKIKLKQLGKNLLSLK